MNSSMVKVSTLKHLVNEVLKISLASLIGGSSGSVLETHYKYVHRNFSIIMAMCTVFAYKPKFE